MKTAKLTVYIAFLALIFLLISSTFLSFLLYTFIHHPTNSYTLGVFQSDPKFGHIPIPENEGVYLLTDGTYKLIYTDQKSSRTIKNNKFKEEDEIEYVFIGDSYTFGDGIDAESSFPFLFQNHYNKRIVNFAVSGYNYAHSLLKLREISKWEVQPKKIIVQLSPWLVERSTKRSMAGFLKLQVPFLYWDKDDSRIRISLPLYESKVFSIWKNKNLKELYPKYNFSNFIRFHATAGNSAFISMFFNEITHINEFLAYAKIKKLDAIEAYFITESTKLFSDSTLVFLNIGQQKKYKDLDAYGNYQYINTYKVLTDKLQEGEDFDKKYRISSTINNEVIDRHYNEIANRLIADYLITELDCFSEQ